MHNATEMLHRQLHLYSDSLRSGRSRDLSPWEVEASLETGLSIFRLIRRLDEHWGETVRSGSAPLSEGDAREMSGLYEEWLRNVAGPLGRLSEFEAQGCSLADANEIREAEREARGQLNMSLDAALRAGGQVHHGDAATLPQVDEAAIQQFPA
jgi:hypothetical protein